MKERKREEEGEGEGGGGLVEGRFEREAERGERLTGTEEEFASECWSLRERRRESESRVLTRESGRGRGRVGEGEERGSERLRARDGV